MKVVTSKQMAAIESRAYDAGSSEKEFMEAAGKGVADAVVDFIRRYSLKKRVVLLCGKGNNGGDAHVAGCYLADAEYEVVAFQVGALDQCSALCKENCLRLQGKGVDIRFAASAEDIALGDDGVIVDGLFGTGLSSPPREPYAAIIEKANGSGLPVISVDIPSGLNGDTGHADGAVIRASSTVFLGLPKRGFFLVDGWNAVGKLHYVDFGLPQKFIEEETAAMEAFDKGVFPKMMPPIVANRHKYQAGYVVGLAGSPGMPGAANLAAAAAMRGGAGYVRLLHPKGMEAELGGSMYELVKTGYDKGDAEKVVEQINKASAAFIGPAIGLGEDAAALLRKVLLNITVPCVIDADALTLIAREKIPIPKNAVITPHVGEMRRLLHSDDKGPVDGAFIDRCQRYAKDNGVVLVLKGGPSFVFHQSDPIAVNPYGDPGMATAGSGDVLTGLIAALLAQGLDVKDAAQAGVFIHSYAGELASAELTPYCMVASSITDKFEQVFKMIPNYRQ